jgi:hypothetical protein
MLACYSETDVSVTKLPKACYHMGSETHYFESQQ